jgi:hypothetical protein
MTERQDEAIVAIAEEMGVPADLVQASITRIENSARMSDGSFYIPKCWRPGCLHVLWPGFFEEIGGGAQSVLYMVSCREHGTMFIPPAEFVAPREMADAATPSP